MERNGKESKRKKSPSKKKVVDDDYIMPSGKYKGMALKDIPAQYFLYCYGIKRLPGNIIKYVQMNFLNLLSRAKYEAEEKA